MVQATTSDQCKWTSEAITMMRETSKIQGMFRSVEVLALLCISLALCATTQGALFPNSSEQTLLTEVADAQLFIEYLFSVKQLCHLGSEAMLSTCQSKNWKVACGANQVFKQISVWFLLV